MRSVYLHRIVFVYLCICACAVRYLRVSHLRVMLENDKKICFRMRSNVDLLPDWPLTSWDSPLARNFKLTCLYVSTIRWCESSGTRTTAGHVQVTVICANIPPVYACWVDSSRSSSFTRTCMQALIHTDARQLISTEEGRSGRSEATNRCGSHLCSREKRIRLHLWCVWGGGFDAPRDQYRDIGV